MTLLVRTQLFAAGVSDGVLTRTGVPGEMPRAAPSEQRVTLCQPALISTRSDSSSRRPSSTSTRSTLPSLSRITNGLTP